MTKIVGEFNEHRTITSNLTVQGSLSGGATVKDNGNLVVQGNLSGPVIVEAGGIVSVQGSVVGDVFLRGGMLLVAGVWEADLIESDGQLGLAVGSVVDRHIMQTDGSLQEPRGVATVNVTLDNDSYRFLTHSGQFVRIEELARESNRSDGAAENSPGPEGSD